MIEVELKWSQSELARQLGMTPSAVSYLASGRTQPSSRTMKAVELVLEKAAPGMWERAVKAESQSQDETLTYPDHRPNAMMLEDEHYNRLRSLPEPQQRAVEALIDSLTPSSKATDAAQASGVSASRAARELGRGSQPSPPTGGHTSYRRKPKRGTGGHSSTPPPPQGPAPT